MTEREKIISLANSCGTTEQNICGENLFVFYVSDLEAFYKAAQIEAYEKAYEKAINEIQKYLFVSEGVDAIRQLKEQS